LAALCWEMGLDVVSEGVETEAELECLASLGCDLFQGYFFGRPGPAFVEPTFP
jgi:EAL domain-containing protein (putative c-di-GMP-specific phosphodiesterase class I)